MNLKPWLGYAQRALCERHIPEEAFASAIANLAESWIGQPNDASSAPALALFPPDDIPLSEAILHLSALQPQQQALKKNSGQYFTPLSLAENLLNASVRKSNGTVRAESCGKGLTFLDPACGSGVFLYVAARMAAQVTPSSGLDTTRKRATFVNDCLFGIEKDPQVARLARATLTAWILEGAGVAEGVGVGAGIRAEAEAEARLGVHATFLAEAAQITTAKILCDDALLGDAWRSSHFDCVVGNPPFLGVRRGRIPVSEKAALQHRFKTAQGQFDLYALFVEDALTRINEGGFIAFVLPRPLLSNHYSALLRNLLARETTVHNILDFGKPFQAGVEIIGLVASGNSAVSTVTKPETAISSPSAGSANAGSTGHAGIREQQALPVMLFHTPENGLANLVERLSVEFPLLGDLTVSWRGLEFGKKDAAIIKSRISAGALPILQGSDVQRYAIKTPTRFYSPAEESTMGGMQKRRTFSSKFPAGKLLVRRVFPGLAAAYDPDPNLTLNTIYVLMARPEYAKAPHFSYLHWFLLGVINSGIASFWFRNAFVFQENLFPYVRLSQLRRLPCPPPDHPYASQLAELAHTLSLAHQKSSAPGYEALQQTEQHLEILLADMLGLSEPERKMIQLSLSQIGSK
ncbi:MAG TPA: hypothetical protein DD782_07375 [Firmicutes bacterium]|nr:hypothetical protein [Bacillota bacterium]